MDIRTFTQAELSKLSMEDFWDMCSAQCLQHERMRLAELKCIAGNESAESTPQQSKDPWRWRSTLSACESTLKPWQPISNADKQSDASLFNNFGLILAYMGRDRWTSSLMTLELGASALGDDHVTDSFFARWIGPVYSEAHADGGDKPVQKNLLGSVSVELAKRICAAERPFKEYGRQCDNVLQMAAAVAYRLG